MERAHRPYLLLPVHKLMIKWLRHNGHKLSKWERSFLKDIKNKQKLSIKQLDKINEIYLVIKENKPRCIGQEHYRHEYDISEYAYIHDFNK